MEVDGEGGRSGSIAQHDNQGPSKPSRRRGGYLIATFDSYQYGRCGVWELVGNCVGCQGGRKCFRRPAIDWSVNLAKKQSSRLRRGGEQQNPVNSCMEYHGSRIQNPGSSYLNLCLLLAITKTARLEALFRTTSVPCVGSGICSDCNVMDDIEGRS